MKKKLLLFTAGALLALTSYAQTASGNCGENLRWTFEESTGTLAISGTGEMMNFSQISPTWNAYRTLITNVTIGNGVTTIGWNAFYNCTGLTSVSFAENSVLKTIDNYAFDFCSSLTEITIPESVTSIGYFAFYGCNSLTEITIPGSVASIYYGAFSGCTGLTAINVDAGNYNYTSSDGVLFDRYKTSLICYPAGKQGEYTMPASVISVYYYAFVNCSGLTSITIPNSVAHLRILPQGFHYRVVLWDKHRHHFLYLLSK
jgi:hypothetical protein